MDCADAEVCVLVQDETREALVQIVEITSVDGVDGVVIGPADLAASLRYIGNPTHPDVQGAIRNAARQLAAVGKPAAS